MTDRNIINAVMDAHKKGQTLQYLHGRIRLMQFETFRRVGKNWHYVATINAVDSKAAARLANTRYGFRTIGVRPAYSSAKLFVYRFNKQEN